MGEFTKAFTGSIILSHAERQGSAMINQWVTHLSIDNKDNSFSQRAKSITVLHTFVLQLGLIAAVYNSL